MNVEVVELDDRKAKFVLSGVTHAFANSLRRGMLAEIPTLAIDYVNIYDNTSVLFDEQLALRLGLIPLATDLDSYVLPADCGCGGEGCPQCQVSLTLSVEGPKMAYSTELVSADPSVMPAEVVPIVKLAEGQRISLEAVARLGTGHDHAKWQAGIACGYKNVPRITVLEECDACGMCVDVCPRGVLVIADETVKAVDERACSLCRLCESVCKLDWIKVETYPDSVIFTAESDGSMPVTELIIRSADNIKERATALDEYLGIIDA
ncbi:MAG: DNA-directed RNA polymerase subunit D [Candidatus Methanogaster sp.]|uniref:DNA-directed RNA polymerase subunit D n=1 Tax=Candidatus Methanogaster sp. TaxID=3386292 RepID=A0AC61L586_9EURY|nr:MAG: DNA-directed RNA polymerase subunit D [ANME-2 cluster archaeon]